MWIRRGADDSTLLNDVLVTTTGGRAGRVGRLLFWLFAIAFGVNALGINVFACAPACTNDDVVAGLAQVSDQLHNTAAFFFWVAVVLAFQLSFVAVTLFVNGRTR